MTKLTLIQALCITKTGWLTTEQKKLNDQAWELIQKESRRLHLTFEKELINNKLKEFKEE
jgi:hypothetical protein